MKPRTKFEKTVAASNEGLSAISPKAVEWAVKTWYRILLSALPATNARAAIAEESLTTREKESLYAAPIADTACRLLTR